jgi:hypothetical protein
MLSSRMAGTSLDTDTIGPIVTIMAVAVMAVAALFLTTARPRCSGIKERPASVNQITLPCHGTLLFYLC